MYEDIVNKRFHNQIDEYIKPVIVFDDSGLDADTLFKIYNLETGSHSTTCIYKDKK